MEYKTGDKPGEGAYRCKHCGYVVRLEYVAPGDTVAELERVIRISDGVFKFITVKLADTVEEVA